MRSVLRIVPCTLADARVVVARLHRHHDPSVGGLFALAVVDDADALRGVAVVGRPVARMLDTGWIVEVTRVATDGCANACSALYGAARRAALALGYVGGLTYTLPSESGASLRGAGWRCAGSAGGGSWSVPSRPRVDRVASLWAEGYSAKAIAREIGASRSTVRRRLLAAGFDVGVEQKE